MTFLERFLSEFNFDLITFVFDIIIPAILATLFGGLIGLQRERHERPAGLRTHALVCLGAAVFTLVSSSGFSTLGSIDPTRIAAGVVTGIGFIGAGVIFKQGPLVKGVTTAASIWISAAIGVALGSKLYYLAITITVIGLITLSFLKSFESRIIHAPLYVIKVTTTSNFNDLDGLREFLKEFSHEVKSTKYEIVPEKNEKIYSLYFHSKSRNIHEAIIDGLSQRSGILRVSIN